MQEIFPNVKEVIKEDSNDLKEKIDDLNEILDKTGKGEDEDDQKLFEFGFFTGGKNQKFNKYIGNFGLSSDNLEFLDFLQSDLCKQILENNLKFILKQEIFTMIIQTQINQFLNFLKINKIHQKVSENLTLSMTKIMKIIFNRY